jgi:hypothetical protein
LKTQLSAVPDRAAMAELASDCAKLRAEGERLAKTILQHESTLKRLRKELRDAETVMADQVCRRVDVSDLVIVACSILIESETRVN